MTKEQIDKIGDAYEKARSALSEMQELMPEGYQLDKLVLLSNMIWDCWEETFTKFFRNEHKGN